jgi:hypothetical protein
MSNTTSNNTNTVDFVSWWINDNPQRDINEDTCIVLQAMIGDEINYDLGPYAIEFTSPDSMRFFYANGLDQIVRHLEDTHEGVRFETVSLSDYTDDDE